MEKEKLQVDGLALLPEFSEDAILTSNLLDTPLHGDARISKFIRTVVGQCSSVADIERFNTPSHWVIESRAMLKTGEKMDVVVIGTRDDHGWISYVFIDYKSDQPLDGLRETVKNAIQ